MAREKSSWIRTSWVVAAAAFSVCLGASGASSTRPPGIHHKPHPVAHAAPSDQATTPDGATVPDDTPLPPAPTGGIPDLRATLTADYASTDAAFAGKNSDALLQPYDPAFQNIDMHGATVALPGVEAALVALFTGSRDAAVATRVLEITPTGKDAAQADVKQHIVLLYVDPQTGENSRVTLDNVCRDYWQLTDSGWLKTRSRLISSTRKVEGVQPILPIIHW